VGGLAETSIKSTEVVCSLPVDQLKQAKDTNGKLSETSEGELASVTSDQHSQKPESRKIRGRKSYKAGYAFEDRVAEALFR